MEMLTHAALSVPSLRFRDISSFIVHLITVTTPRQPRPEELRDPCQSK